MAKRRKRLASNGVIISRLQSPFTGKAIVTIMTGLTTPSSNSKTGVMLQVWHLVEDESPVKAVQSGADESICFDCVLRPLLAKLAEKKLGQKQVKCYVNKGHAPERIWQAYHNGSYPDYEDLEDWEQEIVDRKVETSSVRLGAYGEPSADVEVSLRLAKSSKGFTAYTHQWRLPEFQILKDFCMASLDSAEDYQLAKSLGWRTYRVGKESELQVGEIACPHSTKGVQCVDCGLCAGTNFGRMSTVKDIVVDAV